MDDLTLAQLLCDTRMFAVDIHTFPLRSLDPMPAQVSLTLQPGRLVALVGLSGSGKSTLVALLQRLYDANSGSVGHTSYMAPTQLLVAASMWTASACMSCAVRCV
jgi:ABC-type transport system involved in cytochrome bd biosynthesis fused ATPase/permease subunit